MAISDRQWLWTAGFVSVGLVSMALGARIARAELPPAPSPTPGPGPEPGPGPDPGPDPLPAPDEAGPLSQDVLAWFGSLTPEQRMVVDDVVGAELVSDVLEAASLGDDANTRAALDKVEAAYDAMGALQKATATARLASSLGPKADEFIALTEA